MSKNEMLALASESGYSDDNAHIRTIPSTSSMTTESKRTQKKALISHMPVYSLVAKEVVTKKALYITPTKNKYAYNNKLLNG